MPNARHEPSESFLTSTDTHGIKPRLMPQLIPHANIVERATHLSICWLSVNTPHYKEIRDECLATIRYDLSYNVNRECRDFAELLYTMTLEDPERHCMYTGLWTLGLRNRLGGKLIELNTTFSRKKLEE